MPPRPPHVPHYRLRQPGESIFLESASLFNFTPDNDNDDDNDGDKSDRPAYYYNASKSSSARHSVTSSASTSRSTSGMCDVNKPLPPLPPATFVTTCTSSAPDAGKVRGLRKWASRLHLGGRA